MAFSRLFGVACVSTLLTWSPLSGSAAADDPGGAQDWLSVPTTYDAGTYGAGNPQTASLAVSVSASVDCASTPSVCEEDPSPFDKDYLKGFYQVPYAMAVRPFDFSRRALIIDAVAVGGFALFYALEENIRDDAIDPSSQDAKDFFDNFEQFGDYYTILAAAGGSYVAGELTDYRPLQRIGLNGAQGLAIAAIPVRGSKYLFGRKRPSKNAGHDAWFDGGTSFISGHTTVAFTMASVVAHEYRDSDWVPWLAYGTASMVGMQRIYADKHWATDVFVGALVGWGIGQAVSDFDYFTADLPIEMQGMTEPNTHGVVLSYKW